LVDVDDLHRVPVRIGEHRPVIVVVLHPVRVPLPHVAIPFAVATGEEVVIPSGIVVGPIVAYVAVEVRQVDRLAVTATEVLIADYKSDRFVPRMVEDIPQEYVGQLALYRGALRLLYPNHSVRAALIWTAGPALTELPKTVLDAALSSRKAM